MSLQDVREIHTYYGESHILEGVSLTVREGEVVALLGRNGVGKTTTLRSIMQLTPPRNGSITFEGQSLVGLSTYEVARRGIGWIPEDRRILSRLTVEENIILSLPAEASPEQGLQTTFDTFPDLREFQDRRAGTLSGGQQQMLAIARGITGSNRLLLVDEPSEGLAPLIVQAVAETLMRLSRDTTLLLVEQNLPLALRLSDRFYVLDHGQVVDEGQTDDVSPDDPRLRRHLSA